MAASGSPGLQPGSHRNSLNSEHFPPSNGLYNQPSYNSLPPNYDPHFVEDIKTELPHVLPSQQGDLNSPQQFSDYTPYPASESFGLTTSAGVNPANTLLLSSANSSHHGTSQLQIDPNQNFQGHQQPGTENYLSASSAHPSATSNVVWDQVFQAQPSWDQPRAPSECSGVSSGMSPYLGGEEYSEQPSPMVGAQHYPNPGGSMQELLGGDAFGMERFSLSDRGSPCPSTGYHSEANSPYISPQPDNHSLSPVPPMGLGVGGTGMNHIMGPPPAGHGAGPPTGLGIGDETAPRIDISYAPPQRQPTFPDKPGALPDDGALSPPPKSPRRQRAKSDPHFNRSGAPLSRPISQPGSREHSPVRGSTRENSLCPPDPIIAPVGSPASGSTSLKMARRCSTNSLPNRDYILELAHPNRPGATQGDSKRVQKHPATFQCNLCPKRFTRAYNLRSHLRTHTDERPFVCTICGKAFARQHDRKRHEGLHSGEKKFVCRGNLKAGGNWGCTRRFARADALGRHFRSEAGRVCIRPLLDEETAERQRQQMAQQSPVQIMDQMGHFHPTHSDAMGRASSTDTSSMGVSFPSAILEQYPALATMSWGNGDNYDPGDDYDPGDISGFEASGNEYDDDGNVSGNSNHRNSYDGYNNNNNHVSAYQ